MRRLAWTHVLTLLFVGMLLGSVRTAWAVPSDGIAEWSDSVAVVEPPPTAVTPEREALARASQSLGLWGTGGLTLTGVVLIAAAPNNGSNGDLQGLGAAMLGTGVLFGPSMGWARAGYWDRAAAGAVARVGLVGLGLGTGLVVGSRSGDGWEGLGIVLLGITTGVCAASIEGFMECGRMAPYIRTHGPGSGARVSMLTPHGPGVAVTLPLP